MGQFCINLKHVSNELFYCIRNQVAGALFLDLNLAQPIWKRFEPFRERLCLGIEKRLLSFVVCPFLA